MNNTNIALSKAQHELEKYLKVLKDVPTKPKTNGMYVCSCPNEEAHNSGAHNKKLTIGIQETQGNKDITTEEAVKKFGEYMISYVCHAYHGYGQGACSNKVLSKIFKDKYGLGRSARSVHTRIEPHIFPRHDESYLEVNRIGERNTGLFFYTGLAHEKYFALWRSKEGKYFPISYSKHLSDGQYPDIKGEGGWTEHQLWEGNYYPYKFHEFYNTKKEVCNVFEGEGCADKADELFPNAINTTFYLAKNAWKNSQLETLKRFKLVNVFPDNDADGEDSFKKLALKLIDMGINAKLVEYPKKWKDKIKVGWDCKDTIPSGFDIHELIANAKTPIERKTNDYSNIEEDIRRERWTHLTTSRKYYYDHFKNKVVHKENLNDWYEADTKTKREGKAPVKYLHKYAIAQAEGLAFVPNNEKIIWRDKEKYINSYVPPKHKELTQDEIDKIDNKVFLHEIDILCNFEKETSTFFKDTIAFTVQHPDKNLKYATLVVSESEGTGKNFLWSGIFNMMGGKKYCRLMETDQLTSKLGRSWIQDKHVLFVSEIEIVGTRAEVRRQINSIKNLITEDVHSCEPKGVDPFQVYNHFNCFFSSNENQQAIIEDIKSRRWFVTECLMTREDIEEQYPTHFGELEMFVNNKDKIAGLYYFFKNQYKISKEFKPWKALVTQSKEDMARSIRPQLYKDIDELLYEKKKPFEKDLVRSRRIYEYFQSLDFENRTKKYVSFNETEIDKYLLKLGAKKLKNGEGLALTNGERKRGWWIIRNIDHWNNLKGLTNHRLHLEGKYFAPDFTNKQEELPHNEPEFDELLNLKTIMNESDNHVEKSN